MITVRKLPDFVYPAFTEGATVVSAVRLTRVLSFSELELNAFEVCVHHLGKLPWAPYPMGSPRMRRLTSSPKLCPHIQISKNIQLQLKAIATAKLAYLISLKKNLQIVLMKSSGIIPDP